MEECQTWCCLTFQGPDGNPALITEAQAAGIKVGFVYFKDDISIGRIAIISKIVSMTEVT